MTSPLPAAGGSYVRLPDGGLVRAEDAAVLTAPAEAPAAPATPAPTGKKKG